MPTFTPRLMAAAKEFNVGKDTLVDFLVSKGFSKDELRPTSKLTEEMYRELQNSFYSDKELKLRSDATVLPKTMGERVAEQLIQEAKEKGSTLLDLGELGLTSIPESLIGLKDQLIELVLGPNRFDSTYDHRPGRIRINYNTISDLSILSNFGQLKGLYLAWNKVRSLENLSSLLQLERLDLAGVEVHGLEGIETLTNLRVVNLANCKLTSIDRLLRLTNLNVLLLNSNDITSLEVFTKAQFNELETLDLSLNSRLLNEFGALRHLTNLKTLYLRGIGIENASVFEGLTRIKKLYLFGNKIQDPTPIGRLRTLETLDLSGSGLRDPWVLSELEGLKELSLNASEISDLNFLSGMKDLSILSLNRNQISDISPLLSLSGLKDLDLRVNKINDLSPFTGLTALERLRLDDNKIEDIQSMALLTHLRYLGLSDNKITNINPIREFIKKSNYPVDVLFFENVIPKVDATVVDLSDNPITSPPKQYLDAGIDAVLSYWEQQEKLTASLRRTQTVNEAKLIIVGNSNVGKSTLAHLLRTGHLPPANLPSTHGLEFSTWKTGWVINGTELMANIIDFGGQEYYHDTHHLFFNDRALFLLMWEPDSNDNIKKQTPVGDRNKLETIRHFNVDYWINAIELYASSFQYMFNKGAFDLHWGDFHELFAESRTDKKFLTNFVELHWTDLSNLRRSSSASVLLVQTFMDKHGRKFLNMQQLQETYPSLADAISISMNVAEGVSKEIDVLQGKIKALFEDMPDNFGQSYDMSWVTIRDHIEQQEKERYQIMTIAKFRDYFLEHAGVSEGADYSEENIRTMCITLNYWGVILYRYEMEDLRDTVIVNPQYFTGQINKLLTERLRGRNGGIPGKEVPKMLNVDQDEADAFIKVLKVFKILFELPGRGPEAESYYISPMYLEERPTYAGLFLSQFVAYYKISYDGYFHKGILLDCFKELGNELLCEKDLYFCWQWGMVLRRGERVICIEFDDTHLDQVLIKTIRRERESLGRGSFLQDVFKAFDRINRKYRVDIELSCDGIDFISKKLVLDKMASGLNKFDQRGKTFDTRDFSFLLAPSETGSPFKRVFVSYSSKNRKELDQLEAHLKLYKNADVITYWNDLFLTERTGWDEQIKAEMENANILIMLLSPEYLGTDYIIKEEIPIALRYLREPMSRKQVFWVQLKPCSYETFPDIARYPIYPLKEKEDEPSDHAKQKAISEHENQDRQWVKLLKKILEET